MATPDTCDTDTQRDLPIPSLRETVKHTIVPRARGCVLLIHSDRSDVESVQRALRALQFEAHWTRRGLEGLAALRQRRFDLVLIASELPDISGPEITRLLRAEAGGTPLLLLSDRPSICTHLEALAFDRLAIIEKPYTARDVIAAVNGALERHTLDRPSPVRGSQPGAAPGSVAERWGSFVLQTIDAVADPKTITSWAKAVGVSRSALCEYCRLVHVSALDARDFARLLRAICRSGQKWQPEAVLDLADVRTLRKLLSRGGFAGRTVLTPTIQEFLERQRWIPEDNPGLIALRTLLFGTSVAD